MVKKKRQGASGAKKSHRSLPKVNPFELKFNRLKHDVLGKKKASLGVGHPGLSRKRAYEQREKSLGVEYDRRGKVNKIVDKRIGEKNKEISADEKASLRFSAERMRHLKKSSKFNLTDETKESDLLTHGGEELTDIQKYDKIVASDDDDDEMGNIGADVVKVAHFGGGELNTPSTSGARPISRKEIIADLIAKTRQARENKHNVRDEMEAVTEELDAKYLEVLHKVKNSFRPVGATKTSKVDRDDYDELALRLKLDADARATPAERTKTAEELAMEERRQLEELESLRIARMNSEMNKRSHISADADEVDGTSKNKKEKGGFEVRFDSRGKLMNADKVERVSKRKILLDSDEELSDEELGHGDEEEFVDLIQEIDKDSESNTVSKTSGCLEEKQNGKGEEQVDKGAEDNNSNEDEEEEGHDEEEREHRDTDGTGCSGLSISKGDMKKYKSDDKISLEIEDLEVPFVIEMPRTYEKLVDLLSGYPSEKLEVVLLRLIKCYHPSLAEGNKKLLSKLFLHILRFFDACSSGLLTSDTINMLGSLIKAMYVLMKFDVEFTVRCVRALIRQHWKKRLSSLKAPTPFSVIALLRLVASLYPVSDSWHPVCSPSLTLAALTLARSHVTNLTVLARQILLVTVMSDFIEDSKRFVPEAIAFCQGALLTAVENEEHERAPSVVFPISLPHKRMLYVKESQAKDANVEPLKISEVFADVTTPMEECDMRRCQILRALIAVIQKYHILYSAHEHTFSITFTPFLGL
ncbi:hypothetical protein KIN20_036491 [Parelaphostrongylus tenuis]|uniref:Nucleolar protein 14 n=1 Tax=Parelaphostrongylus tenuis TaxID=148309 RepID=A0AAD5RCL8_PARTN|nr:hypothetical protein KIN20_036491 [Parelaphostrongylus tenuis]